MLNWEEGRGGEQQRGGIAVTLPIFPSPLFLLSFITQGFLSALLITFNFFLLPQSSDFLGSAKVQEMMLLKAAEIISPQIPDMPWEDTSAWLQTAYFAPQCEGDSAGAAAPQHAVPVLDFPSQSESESRSDPASATG